MSFWYHVDLSKLFWQHLNWNLLASLPALSYCDLKHHSWQKRLTGGGDWLHVIIMSRTSFRVNLLYSCLNVKELLARSRCHIWSLRGSNGIRTHNHLVRKRTLNHLAKLAKSGRGLELSGSGFDSRCCQKKKDYKGFQNSKMVKYFH